MFKEKNYQKLSLSTPYSHLNSFLWEQKQKNSLIQKQNIMLNTKINFLKQSTNNKIIKQRQDCLQEKQKLRELYTLIKNQQSWIKQTINHIEEKNFDKQWKTKIKIQKKLIKINKQYKELNKKLQKIQKEVYEQDHELKKYSKFLGYYDKYQKEKQIHSDDVLKQLEKQKQELHQLMIYNQLELNNQRKLVKSLNNEVIQILALKNWLKKCPTLIYKSFNKDNFEATEKRPTSKSSCQSSSFDRKNKRITSKALTSQNFKKQFKLKILTNST